MDVGCDADVLGSFVCLFVFFVGGDVSDKKADELTRKRNVLKKFEL